MIRINLREGLGAPVQGAVERMLAEAAPLADAPTVAVDSRMMPHEWIAARSGVLKADAIDHADDHFFPRDQDIAWDIAGFAAEFGLPESRETELAAALASAVGDGSLPHRVPFYAVAYRAFHLGYAQMAISALGAEDPDAVRFRRRGARMAQELRARFASSLPAKSPSLISGHSFPLRS